MIIVIIIIKNKKQTRQKKKKKKKKKKHVKTSSLSNNNVTESQHLLDSISLKLSKAYISLNKRYGRFVNFSNGDSISLQSKLIIAI